MPTTVVKLDGIDADQVSIGQHIDLFNNQQQQQQQIQPNRVDSWTIVIRRQVDEALQRAIETPSSSHNIVVVPRADASSTPPAPPAPATTGPAASLPTVLPSIFLSASSSVSSIPTPSLAIAGGTPTAQSNPPPFTEPVPSDASDMRNSAGGSDSSNQQQGLTTTGKIGIAVGASVGVLIVLGIAVWLHLRRRKKHPESIRSRSRSVMTAGGGGGGEGKGDDAASRKHHESIMSSRSHASMKAASAKAESARAPSTRRAYSIGSPNSARAELDSTTTSPIGTKQDVDDVSIMLPIQMPDEVFVGLAQKKEFAMPIVFELEGTPHQQTTHIAALLDKSKSRNTPPLPPKEVLMAIPVPPIPEELSAEEILQRKSYMSGLDDNKVLTVRKPPKMPSKPPSVASDDSSDSEDDVMLDAEELAELVNQHAKLEKRKQRLMELEMIELQQTALQEKMEMMLRSSRDEKR